VNLIDLAEVAENVKSYERESTVVIASVGAHEFAAHEAHVGFKRKMLGSATGRGVRAGASYCGPAHEAVEIGDRTRLDPRTWEKNVKQWSRRSEQFQPSRNRKRSS